MTWLDANAWWLCGLLAAGAALACLGARRLAAAAVGGLLLADWALWNFTVRAVGFSDAPDLLAFQDAVWLVAVSAMTLTDLRDHTARDVMLLFLAAIATWVAFIATGHASGYWAFASANLYFAAQAVRTGAPSVADVVRSAVELGAGVLRPGRGPAHGAARHIVETSQPGAPAREG